MFTFLPVPNHANDELLGSATKIQLYIIAKSFARLHRSIHNLLLSIHNNCEQTIQMQTVYYQCRFIHIRSTRQTHLGPKRNTFSCSCETAVRSVRFMQRWVAWAGHRLVGSSYLCFLNLCCVGTCRFEQNTIHTRVQAPRCCCMYFITSTTTSSTTSTTGTFKTEIGTLHNFPVREPEGCSAIMSACTSCVFVYICIHLQDHIAHSFILFALLRSHCNDCNALCPRTTYRRGRHSSGCTSSAGPVSFFEISLASLVSLLLPINQSNRLDRSHLAIKLIKNAFLLPKPPNNFRSWKVITKKWTHQV